jgi:excisionase family DNA binding protein
VINYNKKNFGGPSDVRIDEQKTIGIAEAARRMKVSLKYVYDLVYSGKLPAQKTGRTWRIPASAIDSRLKQRGV